MKSPNSRQGMRNVPIGEDIPLQQVQLTPGLDARGRVPVSRLGAAAKTGLGKAERLGVLFCAGLIILGIGLWVFHRATAQLEDSIRSQRIDPNAMSFSVDETSDPSEAIIRYTKMLSRFSEKHPAAERLLEARLNKPIALMSLPELQLIPSECQRAVDDNAVLRSPLPYGAQAELGSGVVRLELAPNHVVSYPVEWFKREAPELLLVKVSH